MSTQSELKITLYQPILKWLAVLIGGFLLAPTHILLSIYQFNPSIKWLMILMGSLIVIYALINMISISLRVLSAAISARK